VRVLSRFSRAVATGGWLKWTRRRSTAEGLPLALSRQVQMMLRDLERLALPRRLGWNVAQADARQLPDREPTYSAVITSPPYPNRHDYTRVFGVELMFGFLDWFGTRALRYQSFHSHPEARPRRQAHQPYLPPAAVRTVAAMLRKRRERRLATMVEGYFLDTYLCLGEIKRVCRPGARIAIVVGNAQYQGRALPVDTLVADVGEQAGLACDGVRVIRRRGNSAQQMGRFGRKPSRESIVLFTA
jgi:hypothetical protein